MRVFPATSFMQMYGMTGVHYPQRNGVFFRVVKGLRKHREAVSGGKRRRRGVVQVLCLLALCAGLRRTVHSLYRRKLLEYSSNRFPVLIRSKHFTGYSKSLGRVGIVSFRLGATDDTRADRG